MTLNLSYLKKFVYIWYNICKTHGWCPHSALNCNNIANIYTALGMLKAVLVKKNTLSIRSLCRPLKCWYPSCFIVVWYDTLLFLFEDTMFKVKTNYIKKTCVFHYWKYINIKLNYHQERLRIHPYIGDKLWQTVKINVIFS